ncbi:uncharacterized protein LOC127240608 isoform X2 [Andrographis paniculata]|uniref:uncharacterized protein LOC127240608 isoform X2 n=1 Tax=Andrographis paniculata TaxID=175694 RepID=UPI0021E76112|nr:uncharacterized protein LOC127240608 isoform X2 [Andrographis paniculata]XP_051115337.1 uncharacterized protein LOC127240608 isoform X2 [Andrographis paniculata]XP_051115338.1 uncharacterized protein LOC127240608 isoform X2 [Andrographis paniculata]
MIHQWRGTFSRFPKSTCDFTHRSYVPIEQRNHRIWSTKTWTSAVSSYTSLFKALQAQNYLLNQSRVLISSAGAGHGVQALYEMGVEDVTAVELVESPPLVTRGDPHNLPFFDGVFDLGLGVYLDRSLFPSRYVDQIERTVRGGGVCVVTVEECGSQEVKDIVKLFKKSRFIDAKDVVLAGEKRTRIVMRVKSPF